MRISSIELLRQGDAEADLIEPGERKGWHVYRRHEDGDWEVIESWGDGWSSEHSSPATPATPEMVALLAPMVKAMQVAGWRVLRGNHLQGFATVPLHEQLAAAADHVDYEAEVVGEAADDLTGEIAADAHDQAEAMSDAADALDDAADEARETAAEVFNETGIPETEQPAEVVTGNPTPAFEAAIVAAGNPISNWSTQGRYYNLVLTELIQLGDVGMLDENESRYVLSGFRSGTDATNVAHDISAARRGGISLWGSAADEASGGRGLSEAPEVFGNTGEAIVAAGNPVTPEEIDLISPVHWSRRTRRKAAKK